MIHPVAAPPPQQRVVPAYNVQVLQGDVKVTKRSFNKENRMEEKVVTEPAGFLVTCPKGHKTRIATKEGLEDLGLGEIIPLIDAETSEVVGTTHK